MELLLLSYLAYSLMLYLANTIMISILFGRIYIIIGGVKLVVELGDNILDGALSWGVFMVMWVYWEWLAAGTWVLWLDLLCLYNFIGHLYLHNLWIKHRYDMLVLLDIWFWNEGCLGSYLFDMIPLLWFLVDWLITGQCLFLLVHAIPLLSLVVIILEIQVYFLFDTTHPIVCS